MAIEFTCEVEDDLLRVTAWGRDENLEEVKRYGLAVTRAAVESGCHRVLCDERRLVYEIGVTDLYEYAVFLTEHAPGVQRAAIVCDPRGREEAEFWETAASNRGLQVRVFGDLEAARRWLG